MNISILAPDIKTSSSEFKIIGNAISFGLKGIKGVGNGSVALQNLARQGLSLMEILKISQIDVDKEIIRNQKAIDKAITKLHSINDNIDKERAKIDKVTAKDSVTDSALVRLDKSNLKLNELIESYNENYGIYNELEAEKTELSLMQNNEKINKRVLEALATVGSFDSMSITRKFVIENIDSLIALKSIEDLNSSDEYSTLEKINLEYEKIGMTLTNPFEDLSGINIPEDRPVLFYLSSYERFKKNECKHIVPLINIKLSDLQPSSFLRGMRCSFESTSRSTASPKS
jgi:DNA polymerase III alpha subunit